MPEAQLVGDEEAVVSMLRRLDMVSSGKEAKSLIKQGGVQLNQVVLEDQSAVITRDMLPIVLQVVKRKFVKLV